MLSQLKNLLPFFPSLLLFFHVAGARWDSENGAKYACVCLPERWGKVSGAFVVSSCAFKRIFIALSEYKWPEHKIKTQSNTCTKSCLVVIICNLTNRHTDVLIVWACPPYNEFSNLGLNLVFHLPLFMSVAFTLIP